MPTVHIALEEGFANDTVSVAIDDRNVFHDDNVKTRIRVMTPPPPAPAAAAPAPAAASPEPIGA